MKRVTTKYGTKVKLTKEALANHPEYKDKVGSVRIRADEGCTVFWPEVSRYSTWKYSDIEEV